MAIDLTSARAFWVLEYGEGYPLPYVLDGPYDDNGHKRLLPLFSSEALARAAIPQRIDPRFGEPRPREQRLSDLQLRLRVYWTMGIDEVILDGFQPDGSAGESESILKLSLRMEELAGES